MSRKRQSRPGTIVTHLAPDVESGPEPWTAWWFWFFVLAPVLFNAVFLAPELSTGGQSSNDTAFHSLMIHAASDALRDGANPLDFWIPQLELGFPQFLYYQNLPHLAVVALHRLFLGHVELETVFHVVRYMLLVTFPLTVAWSLRGLGFSAVATGIGAAVASLFAARNKYGFEYSSYIWRGFGLYTQLWGMHLSFLVLPLLVKAVNEGRGYVRTAVLLSVLALSHLVYAYMMAMTSVLVVVMGVPWRTHWRMCVPRTARLALVGVIAGIASSYMLWPFLESSHAYLNSLPGLRTNFVSQSAIIARAVRGNQFDFERLPVLTLLAGIGMVAAVVRRGPARMFGLVGFVLWLVLYFGRPTLGPLDNLLPSHSGFVTFRFNGAIGLFAIMMMGVGGEALWNLVVNRTVLSARWRPMAAFLLVCLWLAPAVLERARFYTLSGQLIADTRTAVAADTDLNTILTAIENNRGGRIFAGPEAGWGGQMRVGKTLAVSDVVNSRRLSGIGNPLQGLALNSSLLFNFRDNDVGMFDAYDVRTVITTAEATVPPFYSPLFKTKRYVAWRVPTTGIAHYVEITGRQAVPSQQALWKASIPWFLSTAPGAHQVIRWDYMAPQGAFSPRPRCVDGGWTLEEHVTSQHISLVVQCASEGALVLKMSYHPNWRVTVDGVVAATYMVSPSFIGFDIPAGRHRVEANYVPTRSKIPLLVFGLMTLTLAGIFRRHLDRPARWIAVKAGAPHKA